MNAFDLIVLIPLAFFGFTGFKNGLVKELLGLIGIVIAVFLSIHYTDSLTTLIRSISGNTSRYLPWICLIILLVGTLITFQALSYLLTGLLKMLALGIPNRILGMLFGFLKSGLVISILLLLLAGVGIPSKTTQEKSFTYPYLILLAPAAYNAVAFIYPGAKNYTQTVQKTIDTFDPLNHIPTLDKK